MAGGSSTGDVASEAGSVSAAEFAGQAVAGDAPKTDGGPASRPRMRRVESAARGQARGAGVTGCGRGSLGQRVHRLALTKFGHGGFEIEAEKIGVETQEAASLRGGGHGRVVVCLQRLQISGRRTRVASAAFSMLIWRERRICLRRCPMVSGMAKVYHNQKPVFAFGGKRVSALVGIIQQALREFRERLPGGDFGWSFGFGFGLFDFGLRFFFPLPQPLRLRGGR